MRIDNNYNPNLVTPDPIRLMSVKDLDRIKLNVGGQKFETSADTLKKFESFFSRLLASDIPQKVDAENYILIDRDGTHFGEILNFMRNCYIDFGDNVKAAKAIRMEADFYQLQELIQKCDEFLTSPMAYFATYSRGIYAAEERQCMIQTGKPIVFLRIGRLGFNENLIPAKAEARQKAIGKSLETFMNLRSQYRHFTFIIDYSNTSDATISLYFFFDKRALKHLTLMYHNYAVNENTDIPILEATNLMSAKIIEKLTGQPTMVEFQPPSYKRKA